MKCEYNPDAGEILRNRYSLIRVGGKRKYLGSYRSEAEAHAAYVKASQQMHERV